MWIDLKKEQKKKVLEQTGNFYGLPIFAIEKDWWVTILLKAIFQSKYAEFIFFKGGTSLSKAYHLIERFSEDIDLILDKSVLGFDVVNSKTKIKQLRKASGHFIIHEFREELIRQLELLGISSSSYEIRYQAEVNDMSDPMVLEVYYVSEIPEVVSYIQKRVILEIGARSMTEPVESKLISSFIDQYYTKQIFSILPFNVRVVVPTRTFLEKVLLLHEEFLKPIDLIRVERLSRHLYDLDKIMQSSYGEEALANNELFELIVAHRKIMNPIRGIDYLSHKKGKLSIIPPDEVLSNWKSDYELMQEHMILGHSLEWKDLLQRIKTIENRLNARLE